MARSNPIRFLIIKPSSLGDIIHTFPVITLIKKKHPDAEIDWLVNPAFAPVLDYFPEVKNKIFFFRKELGGTLTFLPYFLNLIKEIRARKYDMVFDLQGLLRSATIAKVSRKKKLVGFAEPREKAAAAFYDEKIKIPDTAVHAVEKNAFLACSAMNMKFSVPCPEIPELKKYSTNLNNILKKKGISTRNKKQIGVIPGARWKTKKWPPEFFAEVINTLNIPGNGLNFIIIGSPDEKDTANEILSMTAGNNDNIYSIAGDTGTGELVELIRKCAIVITNDSGPMHIAAALKIPVFALFGPTDPSKTGPYGNIHQIFQPDLSCIKCLKRYCSKDIIECHKTVSPAEVVEKLKVTLESVKDD